MATSDHQLLTASTAAKTDLPFRILDEGSLRSDLARRREIKYLMNGSDIVKLRRLLETNCHRQVFNDHVSTVRSIYYDDVRLSACRANLAGIGRRRKVRLRWYDSLRPAHEFYFEIKWRENQITGKHRVQLHSRELLESLSYKQIYQLLNATLPEKYVRDLHLYHEPIMIVQYKREHFLSTDGCLRITLDYDLGFYDQSGKRMVTTSFLRRRDGFVLLEAKVPAGREAELPRLFHPFQLRAGSCSKYVEGCRALGLIGSHE